MQEQWIVEPERGFQVLSSDPWWNPRQRRGRSGIGARGVASIELA